MSPSLRAAPAPSLTSLAEFLHRTAPGRAGSFVAAVHPQAHELALTTWPIPPRAHHPAEALIGFRAPPSWQAIGLISTGRRRALPGGESTPVRVTVLTDRLGHTASVLEGAGEALEVISETPEGWVSDALGRALGRPTPPPTDRLARWVEAAWLDAIATVVLAAPGGVRSWSHLAHLHPLHPPGRALPGALLAVEAEAIDLESSWARIRHLWSHHPDPSSTVHPPGGQTVALAAWFDDGSFSRWVQRFLPPAEELLPAVLDGVSADLAAQLLDALITIVPPRPEGRQIRGRPAP